MSHIPDDTAAKSVKRGVEFPIDPSEHHELIAGLFNALVGNRYYELLDLANEPVDVSMEAKHRHIAQAIRDTARWFSVSIKERFDEAADTMAAQWIGAEVLIPRRS